VTLVSIIPNAHLEGPMQLVIARLAFVMLLLLQSEQPAMVPFRAHPVNIAT